MGLYKNFSRFILVSAMLILLSVSLVAAGSTVNSVTLNGGSSVSVAPGESITVEMFVTTEGAPYNDWRTTQYSFGGTPVCIGDPEPDFESPGTYDDSFVIPAPASPGTYSLSFWSANSIGCDYLSGEYMMADAVTVEDASACGDGVLDSGEECDDGNTNNNDGCDDSCDIETGWSCDDEPSVCEEVCGDGIETAGEECDDGNYYNHDSCVDCMDAECGDGFVYWLGPEECDDGDTSSGDGCDSTCHFEEAYVCEADLDVMLVIDKSGTMAAVDNGHTRLYNAQEAAKTFVGLMDDSKDYVGLVSFATLADEDSGLSNSFPTVISKINGITIPGAVADARTNIAEGLRKAQVEIDANGRGDNAIILLSDGAPNEHGEPAISCADYTGTPTDCTTAALAEATYAKSQNTEIFVIGLGVTSVTETFLEQIATDSAHYYPALTSGELEEIYTIISQEICPCEGFDCSINTAECNLGFCNHISDECDFEPEDYSTPCTADDDLCTTDHCDGLGSCVVLGDTECPEPGECEDANECNPLNGQCEITYSQLSTPCEADADLCTIDHCDGSGYCVTFDGVDCTSYDLSIIDECFYNPDLIDFTWDYFGGFTSQCIPASGDCTTGVVDLTHVCSVAECNADCDQYNPCEDNTCSETHNDYCVGLQLADYNGDQVENSLLVTDNCGRDCLADCTCTDCSVDCSATPTIECVAGECSAECDSSDDCDDSIGSTIDTCLGDCSCDHRYVELIEKDSKVAQALPTSNFGLGRYMIINPKTAGIDRGYIRIDLTPLPGDPVSSADLKLALYYTGREVAGTQIEAWYCPDHDFGETTINWENQPMDGDCTLADTFTVPARVIAGIPETWHTYDIAEEINEELANGDGLFTVVLKSNEEHTGVSNNQKFVQYLTMDYSEAEFRPKIEIA
ncbi:MAG: VWA domain-containing protein [bacterium]|nr:VWA domain-containing protein [bacterium]